MKIRSMFSRAACALAVLALAMPFSGAARALDEITVAYFLQWPTANQVAQLDKTYDEALGVKVNWRAFGNGNEMTAAMAGGDVHIAYSQGFVPFVVGVTRGLPLKLVGVAVTYAENDNCIVHPKAGVTKDNAKGAGGQDGHDSDRQCDPLQAACGRWGHLGVDADNVKIVPADSGNDVAAAFSRGDIDMGCAFGGPLNAMQAEGGKPLMTGAEQEAVGIQTFDIVSTTEKFAQENPDLLVKFLQVTEDANNAYKIYPAKHYEAIAKAAEDSVENTVGFLKKFGFPLRRGAAERPVDGRRRPKNRQGRCRPAGGKRADGRGAGRLRPHSGRQLPAQGAVRDSRAKKRLPPLGLRGYVAPIGRRRLDGV